MQGNNARELRATLDGDIAALQTIVDEADLFPGELLPEMFATSTADGADDAIWLTALLHGRPVGFCYAEPEPLAGGTWNLRAMAVHPSRQRHGLGGSLVDTLEDKLRASRQRVLIIDTAASDEFAAARKFYLAKGFVEEARLRDFWAEGVDKVTYWKALA